MKGYCGWHNLRPESIWPKVTPSSFCLDLKAIRSRAFYMIACTFAVGLNFGVLWVGKTKKWNEIDDCEWNPIRKSPKDGCFKIRLNMKAVRWRFITAICFLSLVKLKALRFVTVNEMAFFKLTLVQFVKINENKKISLS